jgi:hypothetical protein
LFHEHQKFTQRRGAVTITRITAFSAQYPLASNYVQEIEIYGYLTQEAEADASYDPDLPNEYRNFDFAVRLREGRSYTFVASIPEFIREYMERENEDSFLSPGLVIVRHINERSVIDAVERWLELGLDSRLGLEHYGCLQISSDE